MKRILVTTALVVLVATAGVAEQIEEPAREHAVFWLETYENGSCLAVRLQNTWVPLICERTSPRPSVRVPSPLNGDDKPWPAFVPDSTTVEQVIAHINAIDVRLQAIEKLIADLGAVEETKIQESGAP